MKELKKLQINYEAGYTLIAKHENVHEMQKMKSV